MIVLIMNATIMGHCFRLVEAQLMHELLPCLLMKNRGSSPEDTDLNNLISQENISAIMNLKLRSSAVTKRRLQLSVDTAELVHWMDGVRRPCCLRRHGLKLVLQT
jgi:hypothetical protein